MLISRILDAGRFSPLSCGGVVVDVPKSGTVMITLPRKPKALPHY